MGFLTALIYLILSFVAGLLLISLSLDIVDGAIFLNYLQKEVLSDSSLRLIFILVGAMLILLALRYLQLSFTSSRKSKAIDFESPQGKVSITIFAIEDMLKKIIEKRPELSHVKPKVLLRKNGIEVTTRGILTSEVNLVEFTKEMQEIIKTKMHTLLGEDKPVKINLEIRKVSFEGKKGEIDDKDPEIPFRNY